MTEPPVVVVKFGGAALERPEAVAERVKALRAERMSVVIVVSARGGVTDRLVDCADHPSDRRRHAVALASIERRHPRLLAPDSKLVAGLRRAMTRVEEGHGPDDRVERLLSYGERLSAAWVSAALRRAGVDATSIESDRAGLVVRRDLDGTVIDLADSAIRFVPTLRRLLNRGRTPVVTGYFGALPSRRVVTLGRGGSDYSATAIGAMLGARRVELVKREAPVMSADPAQIPNAFVVPRLSYGEAEELARFGARVLHPQTLEPARPVGLEVWVRALGDDSAVTVIGPPRAGESRRAVTYLPGLSMLQARVPEGRAPEATVTRLAAELGRAGVPVVTWLTAPGGVGIALARGANTKSKGGAQDLKYAGGAPGPLTRIDLVTLVGDGVVSDYGRVPRTVLRLARGVAVSAHAVSFAVPAGEGVSAMRTIHAAIVAPMGPGHASLRRSGAGRERRPTARAEVGQLAAAGASARRSTIVAPAGPGSPSIRADG